MKNPKTIRSLFALPGFTASSRILGVFGDRDARVIRLTRRKKPRFVRTAVTAAGDVTARSSACARSLGRRLAHQLEFERWRVHCPRCGGVHVEHLDWLAKNPRYTQRFAMHVGKLCRDMPNKAVAEMERLHHSTVKDLDKLYMQSQVERAGLPALRAIGNTRYPSARGTTTASSSATWSANARSGLAARGERKRTSICFSRPWARKRARTSNWQPWTCGNRFATRS